MKIIRIFFRFLLLVILGLVLFAGGYYFAVTRNVALSPEKLLFKEENVAIYDGENNLLVGAGNAFFKQTTAIGEIPEYTKKAFVDIEDRRFYRHNGYDLKAIARAALNNLKARSFKEGASTISQQLVKNTHLSGEKTLKRKMQEFKLTRELEKRYSKEEILERYLNTIYFGHGAFGITAASEFYFGKAPAELNLAESAILAGIVKSPNNYSPFKAPEKCISRRNTVLSVMRALDSITETQKIDATNVPLPVPTATQRENGYAHFVFDELTILAEKYNFKMGGKIEIFTYLDADLQKNLEKIANDYTASDKTFLVLDGNTRGYKACLSTVGNIKRLPGSLIKPLLVYAPALEEDILSPATPILDNKVDYGGYAPENYDGKYHGYVSARECLEKSLNIPAVKALQTLTVQKGVGYLEKLGLPVEEEDRSLALALGGMKEGFTLKEIISGYSTLQKGGETAACGFISSVKINDRPVYRKPTEKRRVFSEETAYLATDMLKSTAKVGTAKKLRTLPFEIEAKTGTAGTKKGNTDAYALSYTTKDCVGVWLGNADNTFIENTGGGAPCNLLYQINKLLEKQYGEKGIKIANFPACKNVRRVDLDKAAYYDTHTLLLADELAPENYRISELFKSSAIPLNKSTSFSSPSIVAPTLSLKGNAVLLTFDERSPTYYEYKIDRYDYATHTTVYQGEFIKTFTDSGLHENKTYLYTVTPMYDGREGTPIALPAVTTKAGGLKIEDYKILEKEWWDY